MAKSPSVVGVLALQGAFMKHAEMLKNIGASVIEVRKPQDLVKCDGLIIPGGESTTIFKHIAFIGLRDPLKEFAQKKPIFGTCAGLIIMSHEILGCSVGAGSIRVDSAGGDLTGMGSIQNSSQPLDLLNVTIERNAFGRQAESFKKEIEVILKPAGPVIFPAIFIRAPRIRSVDSNVQVLAEFDGEPVLVQQGRHLGATFHPELSDQTSIHAYFLKLIRQ